MMSSELKPFYTSEDHCVGDLRRKFITHPMFQARVRISPSEAAGSTTLGFYRGRQSGVHDAYRTLRKHFPKAAAALLCAYEMDSDGAVSL